MLMMIERRLGRAFFIRSIGIGSSSHIFVDSDFLILLTLSSVNSLNAGNFGGALDAVLYIGETI